MTVNAVGDRLRKPVSAAPRASSRNPLYLVGSLALGLGVWFVVAGLYGPEVFASPGDTLAAAVDLARSGELWLATQASAGRILAGWSLGVLLGAPIGLLMGRIQLIGRLLDPYVQFFRFVPPISFVTLAVVWLGIGEASKIVLIVYTSVFIVAINTLAGVVAINENQLRAAATLGASRRQLLHAVVLPAVVPYIFTGARLAMGNSFLTIVSAEMVAANTGLGALIWQSRNFGRIDWIFVGIIVLGVLGFLFDRIVLWIGRRALMRFGVKG
ncbi:ABC transporter permease [Georgenia yuyongxinii]|uniref:ABC transporter permease n=1 Tax=Georgenia yuyongxinii TaxID=2589797 RepID=A0A5B8C009_9MICO|nr:ABC transporter permease [Georgenia yuyongxinii]QDC23864.1 ABC transporter permease [Georgenia yuyongxinii]